MVCSQYCFPFICFTTLFVSQAYSKFSNIRMSRSIDAFMFTLLSELPYDVSLVNDNARGQDKQRSLFVDVPLVFMSSRVCSLSFTKILKKHFRLTAYVIQCSLHFFNLILPPSSLQSTCAEWLLKLFGAAATVAILQSASFKDNWLLEEWSYRPPFPRGICSKLKSCGGSGISPFMMIPPPLVRIAVASRGGKLDEALILNIVILDEINKLLYKQSVS
jgi:hypothetical protein